MRGLSSRLWLYAPFLHLSNISPNGDQRGKPHLRGLAQPEVEIPLFGLFEIGSAIRNEAFFALFRSSVKVFFAFHGSHSSRHKYQ